MLENNSSVDDILACLLPSITEEENDMEENFPTVSLDDNFWMEEPVQERHLCIHENARHDPCPYPYPYGLNQLHHAQEDSIQYIDLSDVFDFLMLWYLLLLMIYQVRKISLNSEENTNMEYTCDTLLIDCSRLIVTHLLW